MWLVKNKKGRIASIFSLVLWSVCLLMLFMKGDWTIGPSLLVLAFIMLLALTGVRLYQEWVEDGEWLE